jgi:hypothetical protein
MKSYLNQFGFFEGAINPDYAGADFPHTLIDAAAPGSEPPRFFAWAWSGTDWVLAPDNRGRIWYLASDTEVEYVGKTPADLPPSGYVEFVNGVGKVAGASEALKKAKDAQWALIKQARAAAIAAPLVTPYGTFDADEYSRTAITDSVLLLQTLSKRGRPATIRFTLADNTDIDLSVSQIEDVGLMLGEKTNLVFEKGRLLREAIEAATSREAVEAIVW